MNWILAILMCAPPLFPPTGKYVEVTRTRYLVSESWCVNCPARKELFKANGWPEKNIITIVQCEQMFGFRPPHVPYEFIEPEVKVRTVSEQNAERHLRTVHGGSQYHFPGTRVTTTQRTRRWLRR